MELNGAKILYTIHTDIPLLGDFKITQTLVSTWIVMALLSGFAIWLGRNLKLENVSKRQAAAEFIVERLDQFVHDNMGLRSREAAGGLPRFREEDRRAGPHHGARRHGRASVPGCCHRSCQRRLERCEGHRRPLDVYKRQSM